MSHLLRYLCLLLGIALAGLACADIPLPPPAPGEVLVPQEPIMAQIAPPVALPDGSFRLFNLDGDQLRMWSVYPLAPARTTVRTLPGIRIAFGQQTGYSERRPARYASLYTGLGIWLVGPDVLLIRPDGTVITGQLHWPRSGPSVVMATGGSLVVVGGDSWPAPRDFKTSLAVERIWMGPQGRLVQEDLAPVPVDTSGTGVWESLGGYSLLPLDKGRIMLAGGQYRNLTLIYEPTRRHWRTLPGMATGRDRPALALLDDGRVWASGGEGPRNTRGDTTSTSDIWSPATQTWSPGPDLPVPMRDHAVVWTPDRRHILLAGGLFPVVLAWKPSEPRAWIAARHGFQRKGAGIQALPGERLLMSSGLYARAYDEGWGRRAPGSSIVHLELDPVRARSTVWPLATQGALAVRGDRLLAAGGLLHHNLDGGDDDVAVRALELQNLRTGQVLSRVLPFEAAQAQAGWLDDSHVLLHAERGGDQARQWLGVLDTGSGELRALPVPAEGTYMMSDGIHRRMRLLGTHAGAGWLVSEEASVYRVDSVSGRLEPMPRLPRQRTGLVGRVLDTGQVIVAGGEVESELIAVRQDPCESCPLSYQGYGPRLPARRHDMFSPETGEWRSSAPSRAAGTQAVVLASGRVAKVGRTDASSSGGTDTLLELSDADGRTWRSLTWPDGNASPAETGVVLRSVVGDGPDLRDALFVGLYTAEGALRWYWLADAGDPTAPWRELGTSVAPYGFPPGELATGLTNASGQSLWLTGGQAGVAVLAR